MKLFISMILTMNILGDCFPENNMKIPTSQKSLSFIGNSQGINEIEFYKITNEFEKKWNEVVLSTINKKLIITADWNNERVNAHATRDDDNNLVVVMNGGLARHPEMTKDGFKLMLCHELGHHLGGAPKSFRGKSNLRSWSSAEGQADYFATNKCIRSTIDSIYDSSVNPELYIEEGIEYCSGKYCERIAMAAVAVSKVFASLKREWVEPRLDKKDKSIVNATNFSHPNPQCRLDTFIAGSNCDQNEIIIENSDVSATACFYEEKSSRPKCWFSRESY